MKVNAMNAKIVASSSEAVLLGLLEGQPPKLVAELTRDLRIRQALRRTGPKASRAPFVVHRTAPDGGKSAWLSSDLIAKGTIRWNSGELAYVSRADDPAIYSIPSDDDELSEMLVDLDLPEVVRDGLREYLDRAGLLDAPEDVYPVPPRTEPGPADRRLPTVLAAGGAASTVRPARRKLVARGAASTVRLVHPADGRELLVHRRGDEDICTIELMPPPPEVGEEARLTLTVAGRPIKLVAPFSSNGYARVRYSDVEGAVTGDSEWSITRG